MYANNQADAYEISIHTTRKVVTKIVFYMLDNLGISIHTTRKVVTLFFGHNLHRTIHFNPHHPQGGDVYSTLSTVIVSDFNPHHPQGGDFPTMEHHIPV